MKFTIYVLLWKHIRLAGASDVCDASSASRDVTFGSVLLQNRHGARAKAQVSGGEPADLNTVGWSPDALQSVRERLGGSDLPGWASLAKATLSQKAASKVGLPAGLRPGVGAGPWSVTGQGPDPPSPGTSRDYSTVSGYYWPCYATCPTDEFGEEMCAQGWEESDEACNQATGLPWVKHDGFLYQENLHDLHTMIVMMDTVEALTLAWWFLPEHNATFAQVAVDVLRSWFFDQATGMMPRMLYGQAIPGVYDGLPGAFIAPSFRLGTRLSDCVELLRTDADVWTSSDEAGWSQWATAWLEFMQGSEFGKIELGAIGNHATFLFSHKLAIARSIGNSSVILDVVAKLRTGLAGSLAEQILPSGEMPIETARVTGKTYSLMNLAGLFQLGEAVENACRGLECSPAWDWSWEVNGDASDSWESFPDQVSYCKYKGRGSTDSVDACKASCLDSDSCNGVVTRVRYGTLVGCYFKDCRGTLYKHKHFAPDINVYVSYHFVETAPAGSGSVHKALDFLRPYALGSKDWATDFPSTVDGDSTWRELALPLRIAAVKFQDSGYEQEISTVDSQEWFSKYTYWSLLFPPASDSL